MKLGRWGGPWWWRGVGATTVLVGLVVGVVLAQGCTAFGGRARGERLGRMEGSLQWGGDHFVNPQPLTNHYWAMLKNGFTASAHRTPAQPLPVVTGDRQRFATPPDSGLRVTWMGHSSLLLEIDGHRVLTDPIWGERASPLGWVGPQRWYDPRFRWTSCPRSTRWWSHTITTTTWITGPSAR